MEHQTDTERLTITLPPEAERHGDYHEVTVVAEDRSQATVKRNRMHNPMMALYERGSITEEQFEASVQIARVAEMIGRSGSVRSASLEARVDCSGAAKDMLIERLSHAQLEVAYNRWRIHLPVPRRMVIDLAIGSISINTAARLYRIRKTKARSYLIDALNRWINVHDHVRKTIDEDDLKSAQFRAGGGFIA